MISEFTAVLEAEQDGGAVAYAAEFPALRVRGRTPEEARAKLTARLRRRLSRRAERALQRAGKSASFQRLAVDRPLLEGRPEEALAAAANHPELFPDAALWHALIVSGRIDAIPPETPDDDDDEPVDIEGRPISEEIVEDRG